MSRTFLADHEFTAMETPRVVSACSLSITALARFEFEAGRGNEGTKILMVEWEDDDLTRSPSGSWHVGWEGKKNVIPADEQTAENTRRFYFLLPPGVTIPPVITLTYEPDPASASTIKKPDSVQINPLPAIFPAELGATARTSGKKGVLHTLWAKKRLRVLEKEIREESINNVEGVALHMAIQEKEWIEANFGVSIPSASSSAHPLSSSPSHPPTTPISPTGRRMGEKLKGLKLGTSEKDLHKKSGHDEAGAHLLSPDSPDIAVSSFNSFRNVGSTSPRVVAQPPPASVREAQMNTSGGLDFMSNLTQTKSTDSGDELFAKALSPRSPDLPRSPFSFSNGDTKNYVAAKQA